MVNEIRAKMPRVGTRKLYHILQEPLKELNVGRDRLFAILRANQMTITPKRTYRVTTNTHHRFRKHKDLICDMQITHPEQVWVADITYLGQRNNCLYLCFVTDAYSKKIMGYDIADSLDTSGVKRALTMACNNRSYPQQKLIHHSDKGLQYCANDYQLLLNNNKIMCSMTQQYDPYSNAVAERINGIIKNEFNLEDYQLDKKLMKVLIEEVVNIYNQQRPHFSCSMLTPNQMHKQNEIKIKTYKSKNRSQIYSASV